MGGPTVSKRGSHAPIASRYARRGSQGRGRERTRPACATARNSAGSSLLGLDEDPGHLLAHGVGPASVRAAVESPPVVVVRVEVVPDKRLAPEDLPQLPDMRDRDLARHDFRPGPAHVDAGIEFAPDGVQIARAAELPRPPSVRNTGVGQNRKRAPGRCPRTHRYTPFAAPHCAEANDAQRFASSACMRSGMSSNSSAKCSHPRPSICSKRALQARLVLRRGRTGCRAPD